eukprot:gene2571-13410_t
MQEAEAARRRTEVDTQAMLALEQQMSDAERRGHRRRQEEDDAKLRIKAQQDCSRAERTLEGERLMLQRELADLEARDRTLQVQLSHTRYPQVSPHRRSPHRRISPSHRSRSPYRA